MLFTAVQFPLEPHILCSTAR